MPVAPFISREARPPSPLETYDAVLSLGGPGDPTTDEDMPWGPTERRAIEKLLERGTPFMGICLGAQLLAQSPAGARPATATALTRHHAGGRLDAVGGATGRSGVHGGRGV